jgi:putative transposase
LSRCAKVVGVSLRTLERWAKEDGGVDQREGPRTVPGNKLSEREERELLDVLTSPKYRDLSPRQVIPALAEDGRYIASEATAYRVLHKRGLQKHRQNKRPATSRKPAELVAAAPNQVFCWDITYLKASPLGTFYYLYLVTDIFSRRIVAARVYAAENDDNAAELFLDVQERERLKPGQVTLHSDNGGPMKGATLKATLERLGILTSFSRPRVSDDNPYAESLFGTMKSRVGYPRKPFESIVDAQAWVDAFVRWYNEEHRHSGLNWMTPIARHTGRENELLRRRADTYRKARQRHPERWSRGIRDCSPAPAVTLNPSRKNRGVPQAA